MLHKSHLVSFNTLTDFHLEEFMKCPYKFYQQHIRKNHDNKINWRQMVQVVINKIVQDFYQQPSTIRSTKLILELIEKYWLRLNINYFESKSHYYLVLAKVSDYLMQFLMKETKEAPPIFVHDKMCVYVPELEINLSVNFEVAEWGNTSFQVKKFLLEDDPSFIQAFKNLMTVFAKKAFSQIPEKIEIYSLLNGNVHEFYLQYHDYDKALFDIKMMKDIFRDSKNYTKNHNDNECHACPIKAECLNDTVIDEKVSYVMYM